MDNESAKKWFIKKFTQDLFLVFAITWAVLFVLENIKSGVVSNYLSLPHMAVLLLIFGIMALWFRSPAQAEKPARMSKKEIGVLIVLSVALAVFLPAIIEASTALTVLLIVVTIVALWVGTLVIQND